VLWVVLAVAAASVFFVGVGRSRFERRIKVEMRELLAVPPSRDAVVAVVELPAPVARYRELATGGRAPARTMRMRHGGTFRMDQKAEPVAIRGTQLFTADPPGFVWRGEVHMAPGVWIVARDMSVAGQGSMRVLVDSVLPMVDASGQALDRAAAVRLLAEMVWFPTSLFDPRYVTWSPVDPSHARATLRVGGCEVSAVFAFDVSGLPVRVDAERTMDEGHLLPWGGTYRDFRRVEGMLVPFEVEVTWQLATGPYPYAHWILESVELDLAHPVADAVTPHRWSARRVGLAALLGSMVPFATTAAAVSVSAPLTCNQGPSGQRFNVAVTLPSSVEASAVYTIRLDGTSSGRISHFGLNYLHDMTVDYRLPARASYVEGSARIVAGTGTPNVRVRPQLSHRAGIVTLRLPGKVENGTSYTPPSITVDVRATGSPGSSEVLGLERFQLTANAFLVGDVLVSCSASPRPYPIGTTTIMASAQGIPNR
jgi:hypothetical protein